MSKIKALESMLSGKDYDLNRRNGVLTVCAKANSRDASFRCKEVLVTYRRKQGFEVTTGHYSDSANHFFSNAPLMCGDGAKALAAVTQYLEPGVKLREYLDCEDNAVPGEYIGPPPTARPATLVAIMATN